nr:hypothetical protein [uncultured Chryseobacterium sp.]
MERILGYLEGILEEENSGFKLSDEQKEGLQKIKKDHMNNTRKLTLFLRK